jgi:regulator of protease activity HflC (stomatin/prohibitin superfamily)
MFGIRYLKAPPTTYVMHYTGGRLRREGPGLSFLYFAPTSSLVAVPLASRDAPFLFQEVTGDFQDVTVQGQLTYRVTDPRRLAELFDLSVDADLEFLTEDHEKLAERLVHTAQVLARGFLRERDLARVLAEGDALTAQLREGLRTSEVVEAMGVEVLDFSVLAVRPTPETARALEAEAREGLLRRADEAIYERRNASVEQERRIRESELNTEIAVEEKRRTIREKKIAADIAVEQARAELIDTQVDNERKDAESKAYALELTVEKLREVDWRKLMVMHGEGGDAGQALVAMAFQQLAENAGKIGTLNISPELMASLTAARNGE